MLRPLMTGERLALLVYLQSKGTLPRESSAAYPALRSPGDLARGSKRHPELQKLFKVHVIDSHFTCLNTTNDMS